MRLHSKSVSLIIAIAAVFVVAGCGGAAKAVGNGGSTSPATTGGSTPTAMPASGGGSGTGNSVMIQNFAFTPQTLTVKVGTKVTWTNKDSAPHNVTSVDSMATNATPTNLFTSSILNSGQTFSFTFTKPGTYFYECSIHFSMPSMHAKIVVK